MKTYKANDIVIYTDKEGHSFDTFVIFDTDAKTGLTHINHLNLEVSLSELELHPSSANGNAIPMTDEYSFNLFNELKEKYTRFDLSKKTNYVKKTITSLVLYRDMNNPHPIPQAS
jgi:hypothetical protein